MSHSLSPSSLICPSTKKAFINCTYRCQTITIILYQLACMKDSAFLLAGLDFCQLEVSVKSSGHSLAGQQL